MEEIRFKTVSGIDTSDFAKKTQLKDSVNLEYDVDKLDFNKFKNVSCNLSNLKGKVDY